MAPYHDHTVEAILVDYINDPHIFLYRYRNIITDSPEDIKLAFNLLLLEEVTKPYFCLTNKNEPRVISYDLDRTEYKVFSYITMDINFDSLWALRRSRLSILNTGIKPILLKYGPLGSSTYLDPMILNSL